MNKIKSSQVGNYGYDRYENYKAEIESKHLTALYNHLTGVILTVIDASISDITQREALKTILKEKIWESYEPMTNWLYGNMDGRGQSFPY
jgi:GTP1/Obg family GTP-binding protein